MVFFLRNAMIRVRGEKSDNSSIRRSRRDDAYSKTFGDEPCCLTKGRTDRGCIKSDNLHDTHNIFSVHKSSGSYEQKFVSFC